MSPKSSCANVVCVEQEDVKMNVLIALAYLQSLTCSDVGLTWRASEMKGLPGMC